MYTSTQDELDAIKALALNKIVGLSPNIRVFDHVQLQCFEVDISGYGGPILVGLDADSNSFHVVVCRKPLNPRVLSFLNRTIRSMNDIVTSISESGRVVSTTRY